MTHIKSSVLQSTSHSFYSLLCTGNFPHKKKVEEDDFGSSMEAYSVNLDMGHLTKACVTTNNKRQSPKNELHKSLKKEILQLDKKLQDQFQVRSALEKALGHRSSTHEFTSDVEMPKVVKELIKEIAVLEVEVVHLEQDLLALYRKALFDGQATTTTVSPPAKDGRSKSPLTTPQSTPLDPTKAGGQTSKTETLAEEESNGAEREKKSLDSSAEALRYCHSQPLPTMEAFDGQATTVHVSPPGESSAKPVLDCHSQPLATMEADQNASSNITSLPEDLGTSLSDYTRETPNNRLSEDMIKCISTIFCKLAEPPSPHNGPSSPNSSVSSVSGFSSREQCDLLTPGFKKNLPFDVRLDNPYSTMVEVSWIYRDSKKLSDIDHLLQNLRSMIERLGEVDPRKLKHEEKLAFWINIHNALVMHAFFAYGIPQNNVKRVFLLLKAAYNIGGHTISADTIRSSILGCPMSRPGQWLRLLISSRTKFKTKDERHAYAIDHPEPLLHFALCSGSHSDPVVRGYTPERIMQELDSAKEEYIRASFGVHKDEKILLPKIIESFAKNSGMRSSGVLEMIEQTLPESLRKSVKKCQGGKSHKAIEWIPHNFSFRYLISKELVK
ncbi:uncharacterized protein LOC133820008 [Humulus lupulus]|uniref:uncharacterized protein LOC133820008 n=1 Tax=Humulus lupulus TaxID=3486 RepID=UPI002B401E63|nr:uncharacterized protein LOC133820008 [Humulus lupulus]